MWHGSKAVIAWSISGWKASFERSADKENEKSEDKKWKDKRQIIVKQRREWSGLTT